MTATSAPRVSFIESATAPVRRGTGGWLRLALAASLAALGACGKDDAAADGELVWRCTQSPILTLADASCACTGYRAGDEDAFVGAEVSVCDASLPCCFIGPAPADRDGNVVGVQECRCVSNASCAAEMAARDGVTDAGGICPPQ